MLSTASFRDAATSERSVEGGGSTRTWYASAASLAPKRAYPARLSPRPGSTSTVPRVRSPSGFPEGYDDAALVDPGDLTGDDGALLVAYEEDRPVGCGAWRRLGDGTAEIRHLWVDGGRGAWGSDGGCWNGWRPTRTRTG
jgi:hypothetical protein